MQASSLKEQMLQPMLTSLVDLVVGQRFGDAAPAAGREGGWSRLT